MTNELQKRISLAENFSTDLVHEIRNPLTSLKSASEILLETDNQTQRKKLINILNHDVERIERLITDYSQMLKDEVALSREKMKKINLKLIVKSVVDDFNNIYEAKRGIKIILNESNNQQEFFINGIENRIEQIIANLLDNSISFSDDNKNISVKIYKNENENVVLKVIDNGKGFKEINTKKIFDRFYSNRPDAFGEHSGLGLNIVKNLVDLHGATINASNNIEQKGAIVEIVFPKS
jgi:two-component system sensor histidine kinase ChvG